MLKPRCVRNLQLGFLPDGRAIHSTSPVMKDSFLTKFILINLRIIQWNCFYPASFIFISSLVRIFDMYSQFHFPIFHILVKLMRGKNQDTPHLTLSILMYLTVSYVQKFTALHKQGGRGGGIFDTLKHLVVLLMYALCSCDRAS